MEHLIAEVRLRKLSSFTRGSWQYLRWRLSHLPVLLSDSDTQVPILEVEVIGREISMAHRVTDRTKLRTTLFVLGHDSLAFSGSLSGLRVACVLTPFGEPVQLKSCVSLLGAFPQLTQ